MGWVSIRAIECFRESCTKQLIPKMEKRREGGGILALSYYTLKCVKYGRVWVNPWRNFWLCRVMLWVVVGGLCV